MTTSAPAPSLADFRERLRSNGLRATGARLAVLRLLSGERAPTSHPEVAKALASDGWDRATLYRILVDLARVGLLRRVDHGDHVWRYELAEESGPHDEASHPHFLCTLCGDLACLPALKLDLAAQAVPAALRAGQVTIQFRGTCDRCATDEAQPR